MAKLDEILRKVETANDIKDKQEMYQYTIGGITYDVLTMTRKQKADFIYNQKVDNANDVSVGSFVGNFTKPIYECFQLGEAAGKALENGLINRHYDIVGLLFEPAEILEIVNHLVNKNNLANTYKEMVEEQKK